MSRVSLLSRPSTANGSLNQTPALAQAASLATAATKRDAAKRTIKFSKYLDSDSTTNPDDIDKKIRNFLSKKVTKQDKNPSYIYVFSQAGSSQGIYKVGQTKNPPERQKDLERCHGKLELHCLVPCPNVQLFECVVHAELLHYRRKASCPCRLRTDGSESQHTEWFEAELQEILDTVMAWSLYGRMLYSTGLALDGNNQMIPMPGSLTQRSDRWRRLVLGETIRWMDGIPSNVTVVPEKPTPEKLDIAEKDIVESPAPEPSSESESESIFSSPGDYPSSRDTTPATTPETLIDFDNDGNNDYGLSPTRNGKYGMPGSFDVDEEDEDEDGDEEDRLQLPRKGPLFGRAKREEYLPTDDHQSIHPTRDETTAKSDSDSVPDTDADPTGLRNAQIDTEIITHLSSTPSLTATARPGTIYLAKHQTTSSYKIYYRKTNSPRKGQDCYTKTNPYHEIECTNTVRIQKLVLAQFMDCTDNFHCSGCDKMHTNWINAPGEKIIASLRAWLALLEAGYVHTESSMEENVLSQDADRWTRWARNAVAELGNKSEGEGDRRQKDGEDNKDNGSPAGDKSTTEIPQGISRTGTDASCEGNTKDGSRGGRVIQGIKRRVTDLKEGITRQRTGSGESHPPKPEGGGFWKGLIGLK
ncbi:hypothetical protein BJX70DRAFT_359449 [Aspergillus crustosus]